MLLSYCAFLKAVKAWDQILFPDTPPWLCPLPHPRPFKECCFYSPSDSQDEKAAQCCSSSGSVAWQNPVGLPQGTASSWKWCCSVTQARHPLFTACVAKPVQFLTTGWALGACGASEAACDSSSLLSPKRSRVVAFLWVVEWDTHTAYSPLQAALWGTSAICLEVRLQVFRVTTTCGGGGKKRLGTFPNIPHAERQSSHPFSWLSFSNPT